MIMSHLVILVDMFLSMAIKIARSSLVAFINKPQITIVIGEDDRCVEINQVRIIRRITLDIANAVRVMAGVTRRVLTANMLVVITK
jgi:hypothetical protein